MSIPSVTSLEQFNALPAEQKAQWYIPENISTTIPLRTCDEELIELTQYSRERNIRLLVKPILPESPLLFLRVSVADRLLTAAQAILSETDGAYTIMVTDAFRPLTLQRKLFTEISAEIAEKEQLSGRALWERVTQFIADPDLCPPHSTGGAVDCTIAYVTTGQQLNMGTPIDSIDDRAATWHSDIFGEAMAHRIMLFSAMTSAGFVNLATEWWHYSYGDQYWAAFNGQSHALFGSIEHAPTITHSSYA